MTYNAIDAVKDLVTGNLELVSDDIASDRMAICNLCEAKQITFCTICGCQLHMKTRLKEATCPMEKW